METSDLLFKLWPILLALLGGAFWMGILDFRVRDNTKKNEVHTKAIERQRERTQKMEVDQAGWKSTLEGIKADLASINKKLDEK